MPIHHHHQQQPTLLFVVPSSSLSIHQVKNHPNIQFRHHYPHRRTPITPYSKNIFHLLTYNHHSSSSFSSSSSILRASYENFDTLSSTPTPSPILITLIAIILLIAAQTFINGMLKGDRGLGAYLSDGSGYGKSQFKPSKKKGRGDDMAVANDPLPWLKLPRFDFVEVAGQDDDNDKRDGGTTEVGMRMDDKVEKSGKEDDKEGPMLSP